MSRWTESELAALAVAGDYEEFGRRTGYSKSYDAWEVKRRRVFFAPQRAPLLARVLRRLADMVDR